MNGHRRYYAKWSKSGRERQISHGMAYMWNLKEKKKKERDINEYIQNRNRPTDVENKLMFTKG